jgi:hypothetical protein
MFRLSRVSGQPVGDDELLADLRRVAQLLGTSGVSQPQYEQHGEYNVTTVIRRFGSWNEALLAAELSLCNEGDIPDDRLFENLLVLWQYYGPQPRRSELACKPSSISQSPYNRRSGGWTASLKAFVDHANSAEFDSPTPTTPPGQPTTGRQPSLRLRWKILHRDRFTCCACGRSPAMTAGIELHVDHVIPWSKGGETVLENLQTLCLSCNLGKSNSHEG